MNIGKLGIAAAVALALAGCAETGIGPKEGIGTLLGAAAGGWAGSTIGHGKGRLIATAAGTFLGGLIGNQIGRSMDRTDRLYAVRSAGDALEREPDGGYAHWENPNTGNSGYTVPTRTYETAPGRYCREYQTTVVVGGRTQSGYGTACRQPDGSWQVVG